MRFSISRSTVLNSARWLVCSLGLLGGPSSKSETIQPTSFEATLRAFQERYTGGWDGSTSPPPGSAIAWPNAGDGTNPGYFPPTGYYSAHAGTVGVNGAFSAAVSTMVSKLGNVALKFIVDPLWLDGRAYNASWATPTSLYSIRGSSHFNTLSGKSSHERFAEIQSLLQQCEWATSVYYGGTTKIHNRVRADTAWPHYPTSTEAWDAVADMPPSTSTAYSVYGGLSKFDTPPKWSATQWGMNVAMAPSHPSASGGDAHWFFRVYGTGSLLSPAVPTNNLYQAFPCRSGFVNFRISLPRLVRVILCTFPARRGRRRRTGGR